MLGIYVDAKVDIESEMIIFSNIRVGPSKVYEPPSNAGSSPHIGKAVILKPDLRSASLRIGPGSDYDAVGALFAKDRPTLVYTYDDWYLIEFPHGLTAWVSSDLVDIQ